MIYTRCGTPVAILDYIGEDSGKSAFGEQSYGEWVTVYFIAMDGYGDTRDVLVSDLRADNGVAEIVSAIDLVRYPEADGTHPAMIENQYGCLPADDWLRIASILRQVRETGAFVSNDEYGWAGYYTVQLRHAEAADKREEIRALWAALEADPGLADNMAIRDAQLNFSQTSRTDSRARTAENRGRKS